MRTPAAVHRALICVWCLAVRVGRASPADVAVGPEQNAHELTQRAVEHLHRGNELAAAGEHRAAISEWEHAAAFRPDSNVPWNNMANSYSALEESDEALRVARRAFSIHVDHLSSTTLGNMLRAHAQKSRAWIAGQFYEEAESVLLQGMEHLRRTKQRHEHPFWALAMLYWDQGDYIEFLNVAKEGFDYLSREWCSPADQGENSSTEGACQVPDFELDVAEKIYAASTEMAAHAAGRRRYDEALGHLDWAEHIAQTYVSDNLDANLPDFERWCIACARTADEVGGATTCGRALDKCRQDWLDTNRRYLRMMAVRVMGCDWRKRDDDTADFARMCSSPKMHMLLNHTLEFYFECDDGRVCGAGAQPPLHMFGTAMSLEDVLVMGKVQPLQLLDKMLGEDMPTPEWAYPSWNPRVGNAAFKIGCVGVSFYVCVLPTACLSVCAYLAVCAYLSVCAYLAVCCRQHTPFHRHVSFDPCQCVACLSVWRLTYLSVLIS